MRASHVALLAVIAGVALGGGLSWANFGHAPPLQLDSPDELSKSVLDRPIVLVDDRFHDFGSVQRDTKVRHAFRFTNVGKRRLTLERGTTSCTACTIAELARTSLDPGESTTVTVEYKTTHYRPEFRQTAEILTNDSAHPRVELTIRGHLQSTFTVAPERFDFSNVSAAEAKSVDVDILASRAESVRLVKYEFSAAESAPYFEVASQPIAAGQLDPAAAKSGCRVTLTLKPGLPLGPIRQTIHLELEVAGIDQNPVVELPIQGAIESDISIVGRGWKSDFGRLTIGGVKSSQGETRELLLLLRGPQRHDVTISPAKVDPAWLKVSVGQATDLSSGLVTQIPLRIEIPPGAPPVNHLGADQGKYAEILLGTTHPHVKQIRIYVQFIVER